MNSGGGGGGGKHSSAPPTYTVRSATTVTAKGASWHERA
jgi:hypothetical protein